MDILTKGIDFDLRVSRSDVMTTINFETMIPLALFGGNYGESTPTIRVDGNENKDYWQNELLYLNEPQQQMNSRTEIALNSSLGNSSDLDAIQEAIELDLEFMSDFAEVLVEVSFDGVDRVKIEIKITPVEGLEQTEFVYIWDGLQIERDKGLEQLPPLPALDAETILEFNLEGQLV